MENVVERPCTGVINPERPNFVQVQGSYIDDGGYVTEMINIECGSDATGKGQSINHHLGFLKKYPPIKQFSSIGPSEH